MLIYTKKVSSIQNCEYESVRTPHLSAAAIYYHIDLGVSPESDELITWHSLGAWRDRNACGRCIYAPCKAPDTESRAYIIYYIYMYRVKCIGSLAFVYTCDARERKVYTHYTLVCERGRRSELGHNKNRDLGLLTVTSHLLNRLALQPPHVMCKTLSYVHVHSLLVNI